MSLRQGVIRGALSLGSARIAMSLLNAAGIVVLARLLTPDDFGIIAIASAVVSVVAAVTEASLQQALVQCREPTRAHIDTVWTMSLIRAGLIFAVIAFSAWPLAQIYGDERLAGVFLVAGLTGAFMEFYNPLLTLATRELRFRPLALFQIGQKAAGLGLAIGLAFALGNFWGIVLGNALGTLLASLTSYFILPYRPAFSLSRVREIWGFSGWMFLNQLCETLNWRFDQLAIGVSVTKAQLGFYSVADNFAVIPSRELSFPLRNALFPGLSRVVDQPERLRNAFVRAQAGIALVTAPAAIGLALLAQPAVDLFLGPRWAMAAPLLQWLAVTYAFDTFITVVRPLGMAMGQTRYLFLRQLAALFVRIPLILGGLVLGGLVGAAAGRALSSLVNCLISFVVAKRLVSVGVWAQVRSHGLTLASLAAMTAAVLALQAALPPDVAERSALQLLVLVPAGALAYGLAVLALWSLSGRRDGAVTEVLGIAARFPGLAMFGRLRRT
jgi:lipopolysaccharide exporter